MSPSCCHSCGSVSLIESSQGSQHMLCSCTTQLEGETRGAWQAEIISAHIRRQREVCGELQWARHQLLYIFWAKMSLPTPCIDGRPQGQNVVVGTGLKNCMGFRCKNSFLTPASQQFCSAHLSSTYHSLVGFYTHSECMGKRQRTRTSVWEERVRSFGRREGGKGEGHREKECEREWIHQPKFSSNITTQRQKKEHFFFNGK